MSLPKQLRLALAMLVTAAGVYAVIYAVAGTGWFKMKDNDLSRVAGCYAVSGQPLFEIAGRTLLSSKETFAFRGAREKDGDVLVLDGPLRFASRPHPMLVREGTTTKVSISYGPPVRLELWDENDKRVEATQTICR